MCDDTTTADRCSSRQKAASADQEPDCLLLSAFCPLSAAVVHTGGEP
jgi:hypothetical protein